MKWKRKSLKEVGKVLANKNKQTKQFNILVHSSALIELKSDVFPSMLA